MTPFSNDPETLLFALGGLHDANIDRIAWDVATKVMTLEVDDLNANFFGLPEYGGEKPSAIIFSGVENVSLSCDAMADDTQRIYKLMLRKKDNAHKYEMTMQISPGGLLCFDCSGMDFVDRK